MKGIKGLLCSTNMSEQHKQEQAMDVNPPPPPDPNLLQAGEASGEGENPLKSPTKNY